MDELAKTEARNYLCAAGFFLIAAWYLLMIFSQIGSNPIVEPNSYLNVAIGIGLLVIATLLIVLRKRDMIAILFFMMGFYQLFLIFTSFGIWNVLILGFLVLVALVTLTSKDKQKWLLFIIPLIMFLGGLVSVCFGYNVAVAVVFFAVIAVLCLYFAFCCACERCSLLGSKLLTADESTDFKASGSVLGYMLFALSCAGYTIYYILGKSMLPLETMLSVQAISSVLLIFVAILLFAVGKMRFTPVMFLLMGLTDILCIYCSRTMFIGIGILFIVIGLFAMLRKESRILPGIMFILLGLVLIIVDASTIPGLEVLGAVLEGIVALIAIYLSFVVYSQRKLPKF